LMSGLLMPAFPASLYASGKDKIELIKPADSKYIWYDNNGSGRNLYGNFRNVFTLKGKPESATLHLFADTSYQLFVNGKFIEFGPVRFDPRFPQFDTHDISEHLKTGKNVIAVQVNYFGIKTYKSIASQPGLVTWGSVVTDSENISLDSNSKNWRCISSGEHSGYTRKMSFALNPADLFEQGKEEEGWKLPDFIDNHWNAATELINQDGWGLLAPRTIPYMSGKDVPIHEVMAVLPLKKREDWYSFSIPLPHYYEENKGDFSRFIAFSTWIFSPEDQVITAGVFWGEHWVNGIEIPHGPDSESKSMRRNERWELIKGWNHYFGHVGVYYDILNEYLALPAGKGLMVSAEKSFGSDYSFMHTGLVTDSDYNKYLKNKPLPYDPNDTLEETGGWIKVSKSEPAQSPCRETSWDEYGEVFEVMTPEILPGQVFRRREYPDGFSLLLDLDVMNLAFPSIEMEGVKGATIDVTYSEHLLVDKVHIRHKNNYSGGDRIICNNNKIEWIPSHPRGMRYCKITARNTSSDVKINSITFRSANFPAVLKGSFRCSDPCLTEVWEMGMRTQAANMEDVYVDCSGRERGMYARDTIIQYHVNLATFGDQALMNRCLELYGQSAAKSGKFRSVFPNTGDYTTADYSLNLVEGYRNYYDNTGDTGRIKTDWDAILKNLKWFHELADEREDLLLDSEWNIKRGIHSNYGGFHGDLALSKDQMDNTGIHCVFSCTYLMAMQSAEILADAIDKNADAIYLQKRIKRLTNSINARFWDVEKKRYSDNLKRTTYSVPANLFPVMAGIVSHDQLESIREYVSRELRSIFVNGFDPSDGTNTSPNFAFYIFDGLYRAGLADIAENLMKQGWGWALAQGLKTCPEYFRLTSSLCHAWSASPTYYLSKYVLGVHFPKAPDLNEVEIHVQTNQVKHAEGAFPHPEGLIEVEKASSAP